MFCLPKIDVYFFLCMVWTIHWFSCDEPHLHRIYGQRYENVTCATQMANAVKKCLFHTLYILHQHSMLVEHLTICDLFIFYIDRHPIVRINLKGVIEVTSYQFENSFTQNWVSSGWCAVFLSHVFFLFVCFGMLLALTGFP